MTPHIVPRAAARGRSNVATLNLQRCRRQRTEHLQQVNRALEADLRGRLERLRARLAGERP